MGCVDYYPVYFVPLGFMIFNVTLPKKSMRRVRFERTDSLEKTILSPPLLARLGSLRSTYDFIMASNNSCAGLLNRILSPALLAS